MKRIYLLLLAASLLTQVAHAQPTKRRTTSTAQRQGTTAQRQTTTDRATLQFPTAAAMPEDVVWKRDIYRQLDLMKDANAPLYYPVEPQGRQVNLFTYLFRLVLTGRAPAYAYQLDGNESFDEKTRLDVKNLLVSRKSYFAEQDGALQVADSDVPSSDVTRYYIKESIYFDQRAGTFRTRVTALCPVMMIGSSEFDTQATPYPLFWIRYDDVASWLSRLPLMGSNLNNVNRLPADDYFTLNRYDGKIYKTNNLQGRLLAATVQGDDTASLAREQARIEQQLKDFEEHIWGHRPDTTHVDSLADPVKGQERKSASRASSSSRSRRSQVSSSKSSKGSSQSASTPRVSARRQRR